MLDNKTLRVELYENSDGELEYNIAFNDDDDDNIGDGGLCLGSIDDAFGMILEQVKALINNNNNDKQ